MTSRKHAERGVRNLKRLLPHVPIRNGMEFLEIGCGGGHVCRHLATEYKLKVTGTDIDPEMIELAERLSEGVSNARFMAMDASAMPFGDESFDIVLSFGVLHHVVNWQDVLGEIGRVLRPGGYYVFGDLAYSRLGARFVKAISRNYGAYTMEDILQTLAANGVRLTYEEQKKAGLHFKVFVKPGEWNNGKGNMND